MRGLILGAVLLASVASAQPPPASGAIDPPLSPRNASYTIVARLDPPTRAILGDEVVAWRNITSKPASELQFHLYWNAWRNRRSTWMREASLGGVRYDRVRQEDWGTIDVVSIGLVAGPGPDAPVVADLTP